MRIRTLASSSSGNCTVVSHNDIHVLIDAGISLRRIKDGLRSIGLSPADLCCVLVTHDHSDHISGMDMLVKYHKTPVYCSYGTGCGIISGRPEIEPFLNIIAIGSEMDLGGVIVRNFSTPHDATDSVGYAISAGGAKLAYVTDLGCVTAEVAEAAQGADVAIIEANHDKDMLKRGPYPQFLKKRILSSRGHLSNADSASLAVLLAESKTRFVQLAHLSLENNTPELARVTVSEALEGAGFRIGSDVELDVAPRDSFGRVYDV